MHLVLAILLIAIIFILPSFNSQDSWRWLEEKTSKYVEPRAEWQSTLGGNRATTNQSFGDRRPLDLIRKTVIDSYNPELVERGGTYEAEVLYVYSKFDLAALPRDSQIYYESILANARPGARDDEVQHGVVSVNWVIARIPGIHDMLPNPSLYDPVGPAESQYMYWTALEALKPVASFFPIDPYGNQSPPAIGQWVRVSYANIMTFSGGVYHPVDQASAGASPLNTRTVEPILGINSGVGTKRLFGTSAWLDSCRTIATAPDGDFGFGEDNSLSIENIDSQLPSRVGPKIIKEYGDTTSLLTGIKENWERVHCHAWATDTYIEHTPTCLRTNGGNLVEDPSGFGGNPDLGERQENSYYSGLSHVNNGGFGYKLFNLSSVAAEPLRQVVGKVHNMGGLITSFGAKRGLEISGINVEGDPNSSPISNHHFGYAIDLYPYSAMMTSDLLWSPYLVQINYDTARTKNGGDTFSHAAWTIWARISPASGMGRWRIIPANHYANGVIPEGLRGAGTKGSRHEPVWVRAYVVNLTRILNSHGFTGSPARRGYWSNSPNILDSQWFHFQYTRDLEPGKTTVHEALSRSPIPNVKYPDGWVGSPIDQPKYLERIWNGISWT